MVNHIYEEELSSNRTEILFIVLTILFLSLSYWRIAEDDFSLLTIIFILLFIFFLFYSLNYRILHICMTSDSLFLSFGIFKWTIAFSNIKTWYLDDMYTRLIGGAGIHFMFVRKKYRAYLNFLEYQRVVVVLKRKKGPVAQIAFSTECPEQVMRLLEKRVEMNSF
jgi:hypothetical protein